MRRLSTRIRPLTFLTFAVLLVATVATSTVIRRIAEQHEHRLLEDRTSEVVVFLESSLNDIKSSFTTLAAIQQFAADPDAAFQLAGGALVGSDSVRALGVAREADGSFAPTLLAGKGPAIGQPMDAEWNALLRRATAKKDLVTGVLPATTPGETRLALAYAGTTLAGVYFEELVFKPGEPIERDADSPFSDITGALYAGRTADPSSLVLTTVDLPLHGDLVRQTVAVGADKWLLEVSPDGADRGPLADQTRWVVLSVGILLALVTAALVEILSRRRAYALRLVDQRTSQLEEARVTAEDANRSKSEFLSRMSHELRTPLNAVIGFGQLLEMEELDPEQRDSVDQILKAGRHLLALINEVLDISRIESGELALSPEAVHVGELVQEAVELIGPLARQRGIQLSVDRSGVMDVYVFADRQRAKQVLINLLSNAVKYNRARGTVSVSCDQANDADLRISVTDTGPGIPQEQLGHLFTVFERLGAEHTGVEGTGIGLALSLRLVEAMGGRLDVESTLGKGSTFYAELPRVEGPVERYERLGISTDDPAAFDSGSDVEPDRNTVLYIEDNLANLKLVERIFASRANVEVISAMHGRLGLELAREHRPALVLLDLHLPDMNGEEVLRRLRDDPLTSSIPVVILTADATSGQMQRILTAGATAYLTKPIDVRELLATLDDALDHARVSS